MVTMMSVSFHHRPIDCVQCHFWNSVGGGDEEENDNYAIAVNRVNVPIHSGGA
jgi:hypothetical protein